MKLLTPLIIVLGLLAYFFRNKLKSVINKGEVHRFLKGHSLRDCDAFGCGSFHASRTGNRLHKGLDLKLNFGEPVKAPFDCYINRLGKPYANDNRYDLIEVIGVNKFKSYKAKLMYVSTHLSPNINKVYKQGEVIGYAQDISSKYGNGMVNHIHFELYNDKGTLTNPENYV